MPPQSKLHVYRRNPRPWSQPSLSITISYPPSELSYRAIMAEEAASGGALPYGQQQIDHEERAGPRISTLTDAYLQVDHQEIRTIGRDVNHHGIVNNYYYYTSPTSLPNPSPPHDTTTRVPSTAPSTRSERSSGADVSNEIDIVRSHSRCSDGEIKHDSLSSRWKFTSGIVRGCGSRSRAVSKANEARGICSEHVRRSKRIGVLAPRTTQTLRAKREGDHYPWALWNL